MLFSFSVRSCFEAWFGDDSVCISCSYGSWKRAVTQCVVINRCRERWGQVWRQKPPKASSRYYKLCLAIAIRKYLVDRKRFSSHAVKRRCGQEHENISPNESIKWYWYTNMFIRDAVLSTLGLWKHFTTDSELEKPDLAWVLVKRNSEGYLIETKLNVLNHNKKSWSMTFTKKAREIIRQSCNVLFYF